MISETVENKANEVLLNMLNGAEQMGNFVVEKAPEVVQQLLMWHFTVSLFNFVLLLTLIFSGFGFCIYSLTRQNWKSDNPSWIISAIVSGMIGFISLMATSKAMNLNWLQIMVAPDLYLLEYTAELLKEVKGGQE